MRLLFAVVGGYAFAAGLVAMLGASLTRGGLARSEAVMLSAVCGFVAYPVMVLWITSTARPMRLALLVGTSAAAMIVAAPRIVPG